MNDDNVYCACGHLAFWHANFGEGNCDKCGCDKFRDRDEAKALREQS